MLYFILGPSARAREYFARKAWFSQRVFAQGQA